MDLFGKSRGRESGEPTKVYFLAFISVPQQMMSHAATHPHSSSTDTTSPHTSQESRSPWLTFLALALPVFAGAPFAVAAAGFADDCDALAALLAPVAGCCFPAVAGGFAAAFAAFGAADFSAFGCAAFAADFFVFGVVFAILRSPPPSCSVV
jgi:hypothetical protein